MLAGLLFKYLVLAPLRGFEPENINASIAR